MAYQQHRAPFCSTVTCPGGDLLEPLRGYNIDSALLILLEVYIQARNVCWTSASFVSERVLRDTLFAVFVEYLD